MNNITAVVLAAGLSTRLRGPNNETKPAICINGYTIIERNIRNLKSQGFRKIIVTTYHNYQSIENILGDGNKFGVSISYANEDELLDTAGSLFNIRNSLSDPFFVCGGSFIVPYLDIKSVIRTQKESNGAGTIVLSSGVKQDLLSYYGQAKVNDGIVVGFIEKPKNLYSKYVHSTYQVYSHEIFNYFRSHENRLSIPQLIVRLLENKMKINAYLTPNPIINISNKTLFEEAMNLLKIYNL